MFGFVICNRQPVTSKIKRHAISCISFCHIKGQNKSVQLYSAIACKRAMRPVLPVDMRRLGTYFGQAVPACWVGSDDSERNVSLQLYCPPFNPLNEAHVNPAFFLVSGQLNAFRRFGHRPRIKLSLLYTQFNRQRANDQEHLLHDPLFLLLATLARFYHLH